MRALAILALGLAACGNDEAFPDAAVHDASQLDGTVADAAPDAALPTVTIHVGYFGPVADAPVLFHGPDGALLTRTTTDANGDAVAAVPAGSSATAIIASEGELYTVLGLEPGDVVPLGRYPELEAGTQLGSQAFSIPGAKTARFQVCLPCSCSATRGPGSVTVSMIEGCSTAILGDVLATKLDEVDQPSTFFVVRDVALGVGKPIALEGSFGPSPRPIIDFGVLAGIRQVDVGITAMHGDSPWMTASDSAAVVASAPTTFQLYMPDVPDGASFYANLVDDQGGSRLDVQRVAPLPETRVYDVDADLLPIVDTVTPTATGTAWTVRSASTVDGVIAAIGYSGSYWVVVAPGDVTSVTLPALPEDLGAAWAPGDASLFAEVNLFETDRLDGYHDFRQLGSRPAAEFFLYVEQALPPGVNHLRTSFGFFPASAPGVRLRR